MFDKLYKHCKFMFGLLFLFVTLVYLGGGYTAFGILLLGLLTALLSQNPLALLISISLAAILLTFAVGAQAVHEEMEYTLRRKTNENAD